MAATVISYDLRAPGRDYTALHDAIKSLGAWARPLESLWVVQTNTSTTDAAKYLRQFIDANDRLLVFRSNNHGAWYNLAPGTEDWIKQNL